MKYQIDESFFLECFREIVNTPSPTGYYVKLNPVLEQYAARFGYTLTYDNRSTAYLTIPGKDSTKTILVGAHADTVGMMVRTVDKDGKLLVRQLGGVDHATWEGETVIVHTRDGREYTGLCACQAHSPHVFDDSTTMVRTENTMMILLDHKIESKEDVYALGIRSGDFVSVEPRCQFTKEGYIKSRFIDDKGSIACVFAAIKYMYENHLQPQYNTIFAFPYSEEIGMGGSYVPNGVSEYVALDIGLIGPEHEGSEYKVSICAKDILAPYDYELTNRLLGYAEKADVDVALDVFYRYSTDANAAVRAGNNLRAAAFGMAVYCAHGMERTHITGITGTTNLLLAYVLDLK